MGRNTYRIAGSTLLTVLLISACNNGQDNESSAPRTLEDFASGTSIGGANVCQGNNAVAIPDASIKATGDAANAIKQYLTAIPTDIQKAFVALNGQIAVRDNVNELCGSMLNDPKSYQYVAPDRRQFSGCIAYASWKTADGRIESGLTIVHSPNVTAIRHDGVRLFGFLYAQFFARIATNGRVGGTLNDPKPEYIVNPFELQATADMKRGLGQAFLRDMANPLARYNLQQLESILGAGAATRIKSNYLSNPNSDLLNGVTFAYLGDTPAQAADPNVRWVRMQRFYDFTLAEAFDSYHCDANITRKAMSTDFNETYVAFTPVLDGMLRDAKKLLSTKPQGVGFGLAEPTSINQYDYLSYMQEPNYGQNPARFIPSLIDVQPYPNISANIVPPQQYSSLFDRLSPTDPAVAGGTGGAVGMFSPGPSATPSSIYSNTSKASTTLGNISSGTTNNGVNTPIDIDKSQQADILNPQQTLESLQQPAGLSPGLGAFHDGWAQVI